MSYYMGDYYRGDYYRGDPFFGFLGGLIKKGVGALVGLGKKKLLKAPPAITQAVQQVIPRVAPVVRKVGPVVLGGAATLGAGAALGRGAGPDGIPRGYHISKKSGKVVKNRRMHVTNVRALRRAIRRAHGFARVAKKCINFTSPRAARGRAVFKRRRRARA